MTTPSTPQQPRGPTRWRLERRLHVSKLDESLSLFVALFCALVVSSLLILLTGVRVSDGLSSLLAGAFGSRHATLETLVQATPLIFTGLAAAIAFRARIWNIGGEGRFFAGVMGGFWVADTFSRLPVGVMIPVVLIGAAIGGAIWGAIPGFLKARYQTNEIISTVMLNFTILLVLSYLLGGPWRPPDTYYFQTERMPEASWLPRFISSNRLHWGILLALIVTVLVYVLVSRTSFGFELRGLGVNRDAAEFKGISIGATIIIVMAISGAIAGLGGISEVAGIHHRIQLDISPGYGFTGIIIALLGRYNPFGVVIAAVAFGALVNGSTAMQVATGIPSALVEVIQGMTLVFVLIAAISVHYRIRRPQHHE